MFWWKTVVRVAFNGGVDGMVGWVVVRVVVVNEIATAMCGERSRYRKIRRHFIQPSSTRWPSRACCPILMILQS